MSRHYFLATALPSLGEAGSAPPIGLGAFMGYIAGSSAVEPAGVIVLADDLVQHEAYLQGEHQEPDPAVLTDAQVRGEAPLPEALMAWATPHPTHLPPDVLWASYYRYATETARRRSSAFLRQWVGWDVALRNALVEARARALELDPSSHYVALELAADPAPLPGLIRDWETAPDPATALESLFRGTWDWIERVRPFYTFEDDELVAYAAKLVLLHRWRRIAGNENQDRAA